MSAARVKKPAAKKKAATGANKTAPTDVDPHGFIAAIADPARRADAEAVLALMKRVTGERPRMWGGQIVGFGSYHYKYDSGREGDAPMIGFSPRKSALSIYIMPGFSGYDSLLAKLGKHKTGASCLYVSRLSDVDAKVLEKLAAQSYAHMKAKYPA